MSSATLEHYDGVATEDRAARAFYSNARWKNSRDCPRSSRYSVGRLASNELSFQGVDERFSREHFALELQGADWSVRDLGSTNGTFVNGTRIAAPTILRSGDQITAGQLTLRFKGAGARRLQDVVFVDDAPELTTTATLDGVPREERVPDTDRYMRALIRAGRELAGRMPLEDLFELILNLSLETVGASRGAVMIIEDGELVVRAKKGAALRITRAFGTLS